MIKKNRFAEAALLLVAMIWGSGFVVTKGALDYFGPYGLLRLRFMFAAGVLFVLFRNRIVRQSKREFIAGAWIGVFLFLAFATQTVGLLYTTASKQAFITGSNVVMVPFLGALWFRRPLHPKDILTAVLCLFGIGLLSVDLQGGINKGDALTLICAFFYAMHIVSVGHFAKEIDPIALSADQFFVAGVLSIIAYFVAGETLPPLSSAYYGVLYLAAFSTLLCFLLQNMAQKHTTSNRAALLLSTEAVFGGLAGILFLREPVIPRFVMGAILVLIAILWAVYEPKASLSSCDTQP